MATISYQLRAAYNGAYSGGVIAVDDTRDFNVGANLIAGGGVVTGGNITGGTITIDAADGNLVRALDSYAPLLRSGASDPPPVADHAYTHALFREDGLLVRADTLGAQAIARAFGRDFREWGAAALDVDASAVLQAAIDDCYARNDSTPIIIPPVPVLGSAWLANVIIKPNVNIQGLGWRSILRANPGSSTPVIGSIKQTGLTPAPGYAPLDPSRNTIANLFIDGNKGNGATGRGIELVSSNNDTQFDASLERPQQVGDRWPDLDPRLENIYVLNAGGEGFVIGRNMRQTFARGLFAKNCVKQGALINSTDSQFVSCQFGANGDGVLVTGAQNQFVGCKSWYNFGTAVAGYQGTGYGYRITGRNNSLTGCESQDNYGYGTILESESNSLEGHQTGGDTAGCVCFKGSVAVRNTVRFRNTWGDRDQTDALVVVDGTGGQPQLNTVEMAENPATAGTLTSRNSGWVPLKCINGATAGLGTEYRWLPNQGVPGFNNPAAGGTVTPDVAANGVSRINMPAGNITIAAPTNALPGQLWRVQVQQDATGGRTITWNGVFTPAPPALNAGALAITMYTFLNMSVDPAAAVWRCMSKA